MRISEDIENTVNRRYKYEEDTVEPYRDISNEQIDDLEAKDLIQLMELYGADTEELWEGKWSKSSAFAIPSIDDNRETVPERTFAEPFKISHLEIRRDKNVEEVSNLTGTHTNGFLESIPQGQRKAASHVSMDKTPHVSMDAALPEPIIDTASHIFMNKEPHQCKETETQTPPIAVGVVGIKPCVGTSFIVHLLQRKLNNDLGSITVIDMGEQMLINQQNEIDFVILVVDEQILTPGALRCETEKLSHESAKLSHESAKLSHESAARDVEYYEKKAKIKDETDWLALIKLFVSFMNSKGAPYRIVVNRCNGTEEFNAVKNFMFNENAPIYIPEMNLTAIERLASEIRRLPDRFEPK